MHHQNYVINTPPVPQNQEAYQKIQRLQSHHLKAFLHLIQPGPSAALQRSPAHWQSPLRLPVNQQHLPCIRMHQPQHIDQHQAQAPAPAPEKKDVHGLRFDKKECHLPYTVIKSAGGKMFQLLNSVDPRNDRQVAQVLRYLPTQEQHQFRSALKICIGEGGFGRVRLARNMVSGEVMAVKKMTPRKGGIQEIRNLQRLKHLPNSAQKNMVQLHDYTLAPGKNGKQKCYLFEELMLGNDLSLKQNPLYLRQPADAAGKLELAEQLIRPVADLHAHGLYHCDIKPENYLMNTKGHVKLADFGMLKTQKQPYIEGGTPLFMAPEAFTHQFALASKSDAFALGVLLLDIAGHTHPVLEYNAVTKEGNTAGLQKSPLFWRDCDIAIRINNEKKHTVTSIALQLMHPKPSQRLTPAQALNLISQD